MISKDKRVTLLVRIYDFNKSFIVDILYLN